MDNRADSLDSQTGAVDSQGNYLDTKTDSTYDQAESNR